MSSHDASAPPSLRERLGGILTCELWPARRGRPSANAIIAAAELPAAVEGRLREIVRRTGLSWVERSAVAAELAAHFRDGLDRGVSVDDMLGAFGDARAAARLIRRAKIRCRPAWWHALDRFGWCIIWLIAAAVVLYAVQSVRLSWAAPKIERYYVAEWNAAVREIPDADRALPHYLSALGMLDPKETRDCCDAEQPADPNWPVVREFIAERQDAIAAIRDASRKPHLGAFIWRVASLPRGDNMNAMAALGAPTLEQDRDTEAISGVLPHLHHVRRCARLAALDAVAAAEDRDGERLHADLAALIRIAGHSFQGHYLIGDLVGLANTSLAAHSVMRVLADDPSLLSTPNLVELAHGLSAIGPNGELTLRLSFERAIFDDVLQRHYTEDALGSTPRPEMVMVVSGEAGASDVPPGRFLAPLWTGFVAGKESQRREYNRILGAIEKQASTPMWTWDSPDPSGALLAELASRPLAYLRYYPALVMTPALSRAALELERVRQARDAALVAIALELFHRESGDYPASLEALSPRLLPRIPRDRFDGGPIKYRTVGGRPLLYSVGVDRDDDGGRLPAPTQRHRRTYDKPTQRNQLAYDWPTPPPAARDTAQPWTPDGDWVLFPAVRDE